MQILRPLPRPIDLEPLMLGVCVGGNHLSPHDPPGGPDYAPISESLVSVQFNSVQSLSRV